jgi:hypothetical protein
MSVLVVDEVSDTVDGGVESSLTEIDSPSEASSSMSEPSWISSKKALRYSPSGSWNERLLPVPETWNVSRLSKPPVGGGVRRYAAGSGGVIERLIIMIIEVGKEAEVLIVVSFFE